MPRITVVQFKVEGQNRLNLSKAKKFIESASGRSELIVFPELFMNGIFDPEMADEFLSEFRSLAKKNRIDIVPGSIIESRNGKRYNTAYYIDGHGRMLSRYCKRNVWKSEKVEKGGLPNSFKTIFGRTSLIICWDLSSTEVAARLALHKPDLVICPSMWWAGSEAKAKKKDFAKEMTDSLCMARAYECRAAIAYANVAGKVRLKGLTDITVGNSQVTLPFIGAVGRASGTSEQAFTCDIDPKAIARAKNYFG